MVNDDEKRKRFGYTFGLNSEINFTNLINEPRVKKQGKKAKALTKL